MGMPRPISKAAFYSIYAALLGVAIAALWEAGPSLIRRFDAANRRTLEELAFPLVLAMAGAIHGGLDLSLRALGWSRSGRDVEVRRPSPVVPARADGDDLVIRCSPAMSNLCLAFSLGSLAPLLALIWYAKPSPLEEEWLAVGAAYAFSSGMAFLSFVSRYWVVVRMDASGMLGPRGLSGLRRAHVPWEAIADCRFVTTRNTFGERQGWILPKLTDAEGRDLFPALDAYVASVSLEDWDRMIHVLKRRFPKVDDPLWD